MPAKQAKGEYIETDTGNKVSRKSNIVGSQNIILGGKTIIQAECTIRGDLRRTIPSSSSSSSNSANVAIAIGRYCFLSRASILRPPCRILKGQFSYHPMKIGDHVFVGEGSVVEAAVVGNWVKIGKDCVIGKFSIIKDCVRIEDGTVIAPNAVIPSFSLVRGRPGLVVEELPETAPEVLDCESLCS
ncbi:trimeric LpxA-like protein [Terfezia boudieri ATCC MYA-4762]|uniref:Dynactin subunit 5 n=1 Tax=Terfezia boudieri ATCC MYA-4762 TaxID=1051890 RepID=A0A3N4LX63_9PEZI|nr:trimeric LpxA-like protein [Terfezia boudieri ATCC MYA-4762]